MIKISERRISLISHCIAAAAFIALLITSSLLDLEISRAISDSDSVYGMLFATLGETPAYVVLPICGAIFLNCGISYKSAAARYGFRFMAAAMVYLGYFLWGAMGTRITETPHIAELSALYAVPLALFTLLASKYLRIDYNRYARFACFALAVMLSSLIVIRLLKLGWGRVRFRDMLITGDFSAFTPWYKPNGYNGNYSFPSGHSASACNIFIFVVLFNGKRRYIANALSATFVILTMFSRVVYNAHFLSDVLIGAALSYACYYLLRRLFVRRGQIVSAGSAESGAAVISKSENEELC